MKRGLIGKLALAAMVAFAFSPAARAVDTVADSTDTGTRHSAYGADPTGTTDTTVTTRHNSGIGERNDPQTSLPEGATGVTQTQASAGQDPMTAPLGSDKKRDSNSTDTRDQDTVTANPKY